MVTPVLPPLYSVEKNIYNNMQMQESSAPNFQEITMSFSATELSILWQGVKILIERQKENIKGSQPPYTQTLNEHLGRLTTLEQKLREINIEVENEVIEEIRK